MERSSIPATGTIPRRPIDLVHVHEKTVCLASMTHKGGIRMRMEGAHSIYSSICCAAATWTSHRH